MMQFTTTDTVGNDAADQSENEVAGDTSDDDEMISSDRVLVEAPDGTVPLTDGLFELMTRGDRARQDRISIKRDLGDQSDRLDEAEEQRAEIIERLGAIEDQQDELDGLSTRMVEITGRVDDLLGYVDDHELRVAELEQTIEEQREIIDQLRNQVQSLLTVSALDETGACPSCEGELTVNEPFVDVDDSATIECCQCGYTLSSIRNSSEY